MPTYRPPETLNKTLSEPIDFVLGGKQFTLHAIPPQAIEPMQEFFDSAPDDPIEPEDLNDASKIKNVFADINLSGMAQAAERFVRAVVGEEIWQQIAPVDWRELLQFAQWLVPITCEGLGPEMTPEKNSGGKPGKSPANSAGTQKPSSS